MIIGRLKSKLKSFYINFIEPPKVWLLPEKSEVLIYDACGAEALAPYLEKYSITVMEVRQESINLPCLLRAVLRLSFWKGNLLSSYFEAYIQAVSPKIIITFIDNNTWYYSVSRRFPDVKTIFLQNGIRCDIADVFEYLIISENYCVDYMLVMGIAIGRKYSHYISGQTIAIGSLKNNTVSYKYAKPDGSILFISQYRSEPKNNTPFFTDKNKNPYYYQQFYFAEEIVLRFIAKWCVEHNKLLKIAGISALNTLQEFAFFDAILNGYTWEYISRTDQYGSYELVDASEIVVFIDSTLGYESIARGNKTACFSCRGASLNIDSIRFGWPAEMPNNGPFWSNDQDEKQFLRVMNYLNTVTDDEWDKTRIHYMAELIEFDPGNTRFVALLDQLLPKPLNQSYA